jgi:hypothetical protein
MCVFRAAARPVLDRPYSSLNGINPLRFLENVPESTCPRAIAQNAAGNPTAGDSSSKITGRSQLAVVKSWGGVHLLRQIDQIMCCGLYMRPQIPHIEPGTSTRFVPENGSSSHSSGYCRNVDSMDRAPAGPVSSLRSRVD